MSNGFVVRVYVLRIILVGMCIMYCSMLGLFWFLLYFRRYNSGIERK